MYSNAAPMPKELIDSSEKPAYPLWSLRFWKAYIETMRPYLLYVSGAAGLAGLAFTEGVATTGIILASVAFFLSYGLGQALTDCFQTDTDSISAPYRPLVRGLITKAQVFTVSIAGLTVVTLILAYLNPEILILGLLAVVGLITYTPFKRTWWGGPPWNAWIVALLPLMGRLADTNYSILNLSVITRGSSFAFILALCTVFLGYANFVVMGYFKDISADRETGYRTIPVLFGWEKATKISDHLAVYTAILAFSTLFVSSATGEASIWGFFIFSAAAGTSLFAQARLHKTLDEKKTYPMIAGTVRCFILYCVAIAVALKPDWLLFSILFYLFFELTLRLRPDKTQV
jgi:4-hydroxybenzoate polyprenyltransferase